MSVAHGTKRYLTSHDVEKHEKSCPHTYIPFTDIVWIFIDISSQTKVTDLHHFVVRQQNVSGSQVSVNALRIGDHI